MAEAFGGVYKCPNKHNLDLWFFDSKPSEYRCPYCDDGTMAKLTHVKDHSAGGKASAEKKRKTG